MRLVAAYNPQANGLAESMVKTAKACLFKMAEGNLKDFDLFLPAVEIAINGKQARLTNSTPFSLMFGRPFNYPGGQKADTELCTEEALQERARIITECVYPEIEQTKRGKQKTLESKVDKARLVKESRLPVGTLVMLADVQRKGKSEPRWVGPYTVVEATKARTYALLDSTGALLQRKVPLQQLKVVALPADQDHALRTRAGEEVYEVDKILDHRGRQGDRSYLVRWKNFSEEYDSWEPAGNFEDLAVITGYWRTVGAGKRDAEELGTERNNGAGKSVEVLATPDQKAKKFATPARSADKKGARKGEAGVRAKARETSVDEHKEENVRAAPARRSARLKEPSREALEAIAGAS